MIVRKSILIRLIKNGKKRKSHLMYCHNFMSEILVLGFPDDAGAVVLVEPNRKVANGGRLF